MRTITADLAAVQAVRSPRARVTATVSTRGQNPALPAAAWAKLTYAGGGKAGYSSAGFGTSSGGLVRFKALNTGIWQQTLTDPTSAAQWTGNAWTQISADAASGIAALRALGNWAWVFYVSGGNVYYYRSSDEGATWSARFTGYGGGDAAKDVCVAYAPDGHDMEGVLYGWSTYALGVYTANFYVGANRAYLPGWRAAGIAIKDGDTNYAYPLVFSQSGLGYGSARLRSLRSDGDVFDQAKDIDETQAGLFGLNLACYKFCPLPDSTTLIGTAVENAYTGENYEGVGGVFWQDDLLADEPIIFPEIRTWNDRNYSYITKAGADLYYFALDAVWRGRAQAATAETLVPVKYEYSQGIEGAGGVIRVEFEQDAPEVYAGQLLTVRRTLSWGTQSGYEELVFYVTSTLRSKQSYIVEGVDALGFLGVGRCRRPSILNNGNAAGVATVLRRLGARFGLAVSCDEAGLESDAVMAMTLAPNESLAGAAFRVASQSDVYLVPAGDGTFALEMINPPTSDSGEHDESAQDYPDGQWKLIEAEALSDYSRLAFSYVLGTASTDPEDGSYVGMALGPALPNTRPLSYSLTNTRYNTSARVTAAATREAERQKKLTIEGTLTAPANLALELYDVVSVTEPLLGWSAREFRVRRIVEVWDRGRLTQKLTLGVE